MGKRTAIEAMENGKPGHDAPGRTAALLFALADLAERAAILPLPVRLLLLWILRPAEATVRAFILETYGGTSCVMDMSTPVAAPCMSGNAHDLRRLAQSLRMLAFAVDALQDEAWLFDDWSVGLGSRHAVLKRGSVRMALAGLKMVPRLFTADALLAQRLDSS